MRVKIVCGKNGQTDRFGLKALQLVNRLSLSFCIALADFFSDHIGHRLLGCRRVAELLGCRPPIAADLSPLNYDCFSGNFDLPKLV